MLAGDFLRLRPSLALCPPLLGLLHRFTALILFSRSRVLKCGVVFVGLVARFWFERTVNL